MTARDLCLLLLAALPAGALERPGVAFKVFQFPADRIPRIDGDASDWSIVPRDYVIGMDQLKDTVENAKPDPANLDVRVRVGWVRGLNRLYFLYEAYDNYWDFGRNDLHNDFFEVVVDADLSGGPLIQAMHPDKELDPWTAYTSFQSVHAQNYHILTPWREKDWAMVWGCQQHWLRSLPWSNAAVQHNLKPGGSGRLVLEFWITPFDYASCQGPRHSIESTLTENQRIGLSWAIKDYDDSTSPKGPFWNLSHKTTMYGNASDLVAFRLMPLEPPFRKPVEPRWLSRILDVERRLVVFQDLSAGKITSWKWDFGDGATSSEQHPTHAYPKAGPYTVTLEVEGPGGRARHSQVWDVVLK